jgi:hypothetical protein
VSAQYLAEWGRHIVESLRVHALRSPDPRLDAFAAELEGYLPAVAPGSSHLGFAVPLRLRTDECELRLITTLTSFATAVDITLAELHLEAFLPAAAFNPSDGWNVAAVEPDRVQTRNHDDGTPARFATIKRI